MNNCRISIIVPCYNGAEFLRETLDCLQKQTIEDWECVIVNDGSTDNSIEILREYEAKDSRYKVIDKENEGPSVARNVAIAASSGKYILPLDADDLIAPTYAEKAIEYLEQHPQTKLVYCKARFFGDKEGEWELPEYNYNEIIYGNSIFCSCVYRRKDFDKTEGYNPNMKHMLEDWDFLLTLLKPDDDVHCIPEVLFYYRQHGITRTSKDSIKTDMYHLRMELNHPEIYSKDLERSYLFVNSMSRYYKVELNGILNSNAYKLGNTLIKPFRLLKNIIKGGVIKS
ncbi:MAG: glycosyltransferase family 2 protein [Prevotella sp.]|nr:glycosyltransferase family 2 protein [Prevotella sp.]